MPTYSATGFTQNLAATVGHGMANNLKALEATVNCTAALTTADTLRFFRPPRGFVVVMAQLESDDLDTGGSPTLTFNVGDAGDADRLFATSNVGQAGTAAVATVATGIFYEYDGATDVVAVPAANAATGAAGNVRLCLIGFIRDAATS